MNSTITLSQVITRLAKLTDTDTNTARLFVRSFFAAIEESILAGQTVAIKGIGTFKRNTDGTFNGDSPVLFIPDENLAREVNAPFSMFEAVELADGLDFPDEKEEDIVEPETPKAHEAPEVPETHTAPIAPIVPDEKEEAPEAPKAPEAEKTEVEKEETHIPPVTAPVTPIAPVEPKAPVEKEEAPEELEAQPESRKGISPLWLGVALAIIGGSLCGYFAAVYEPDEPAAEELYMPTDSIEAPVIEEVSVEELNSDYAPVEAEPTNIAQENIPEPQAEPEPAPTPAAPKYDTVTSSRYLATMAREYYGKGIYWVFIYQANTDILDNPNKIKPGTRVKIPEKSSFAEDTDAATQRKAERLQSELFKKYK